MFEFLRRQQLQRQGLSCGRKRREQKQSEWLETLRSSPFVRWFIFALFLCGLGLLARSLPETSAFQRLQNEGAMGTLLMLALLPAAAVHLKIEHSCVYERNSRVLLVLLVVMMQLGLVHLVSTVVHLNPQLHGNYLLYFAPFALAPMTLTLLLGREVGFFGVLYTSLWGAMLVDANAALAFVILNFSCGMVGVFATRRLRKRGQLMRAGFWVGVTAMVLCFGLGRMQSPLELWGGRGWDGLAKEVLSALLTGILTATMVNGLLPLLEGIFRITTTISWIELADLNHPLLRRMTLETPGTYHHSLMVANLAEHAAEAVGADPTVCRVCSYFHDIGKLNKPEYCIENISNEDNPHDELTPSMSALVIMAHVKDGVDLAIKHKLNHEIIDVIQQHHGTSLVWFFYRKAMDHQEEMKQKAAEGKAAHTDVPEVAEKAFRYPGPKPQFRESAIISLADAVESASRVLQKPTPQKIEQLVDEIIRSRIRDGQLDECDLTLSDVDSIKRSFTSTLRTSMHRRIPYPEEKAEEARGERPDKAERPSSKAESRDFRDRSELHERPAKPKPAPAAAQINMEDEATARFGARPAL